MSWTPDDETEFQHLTKRRDAERGPLVTDLRMALQAAGIAASYDNLLIGSAETIRAALAPFDPSKPQPADESFRLQFPRSGFYRVHLFGSGNRAIDFIGEEHTVLVTPYCPPPQPPTAPPFRAVPVEQLKKRLAPVPTARWIDDMAVLVRPA